MTSALFAGVAALLTAVAWRLLTWWYWEYTKPESYYGYALYVPVLVGVMLWYRRDSLRAIGADRQPMALFLVVPSIAVLVAATKAELEAVMSASFLLTVIGSVWFVCGTRFVKALRFLLAFLFLMAPLPGTLLNDATLGLQRASIAGAAELLRLVSFGVQQQGNLLRLDHFVLEVSVPCSGFQLLLCLLTFSAAFAYLSDTTRVRQIALFAVSLPLALLLNSIRIAMIAIVGECIGATAAHIFHDWSGMIMLALCMVALFGFAKALGCRKFAGLPLF